MVEEITPVDLAIDEIFKIVGWLPDEKVEEIRKVLIQLTDQN